MEKEWGKAGGLTLTSLAFFFAMMTGSAFYDSEFVNTCLSFLGFEYSVSDETTIKIPVFLTTLSLIVLDRPWPKGTSFNQGALRQPFFPPQTRGCRGLDSDHRPALRYLLAAMILSVIRQFLTIASTYWSVIELPGYSVWSHRHVPDGSFRARLARLLPTEFSDQLLSYLHCPSWTVRNWACHSTLGILLRFALRIHAIHDYLVSRYLNEQASSERRPLH